MSFEREMMRNDELEKTWKEMIVTCLKIVVTAFPGRTAGNHGNENDRTLSRNSNREIPDYLKFVKPSQTIFLLFLENYVYFC
jgi:hypothetical protein